MTPRNAASLGSLIFVPTLVTQPAAAKEVAAALVDAAEAGSQGGREAGRQGGREAFRTSAAHGPNS